MARAGSSLHYQLTAEITGKAIGPLNHYKKTHTEEPLGLTVTKVHRHTDKRGQWIEEGKAKAVYIYRDIRDVVASLSNKTRKTPLMVVRNGYIERALEDFRNWTQHPIHIAQYEWVINNLEEEIRRIASYLGVEISKKRVKEIADKYTLDASRKDDWRIRFGAQVFSGKAGQWKALSRFEIAVIEEKAYKWLKEKYYITQSRFFRKTSFLIYKVFGFFLARMQRNIA